MRSNLDIFFDNVAITETTVSTNFVDVGSFAGTGNPVPIEIFVNETFNNLTSAVFEIQTAPNSDDDPYTTVITTPSILLASLTAGYKTVLNYLPNIEDRYVKVKMTITGTDPDEGKLTAQIVIDHDEPFKDGLYFSPRNPSGAASSA